MELHLNKDKVEKRFYKMIPKDPVMLLSFINMKLRDNNQNLDALCEDMELNKEALMQTLSAIDCHYREEINQFR